MKETTGKRGMGAISNQAASIHTTVPGDRAVQIRKIQETPDIRRFALPLMQVDATHRVAKYFMCASSVVGLSHTIGVTDAARLLIPVRAILRHQAWAHHMAYHPDKEFGMKLMNFLDYGMYQLCTRLKKKVPRCRRKKRYRAIDEEKKNVPGGKNPAPPRYQMECPLLG
jgi:hypothetical protein